VRKLHLIANGLLVLFTVVVSTAAQAESEAAFSRLRILCDRSGADTQEAVYSINTETCSHTIEMTAGDFIVGGSKHRLNQTELKTSSPNLDVQLGLSYEITSFAPDADFKFSQITPGAQPLIVQPAVKPETPTQIVAEVKPAEPIATQPKSEEATKPALKKPDRKKIEAAKQEAQPLDQPTRKSSIVGSKLIKSIRDCADCPEMVEIFAGSYFMGSPNFEARRKENEGPQHLVTFRSAAKATSGSSFALGKYEVTRGQFAAFIKDSHYKYEDKCWTYEDGKSLEREDRGWRNPGYPQEDNHPVVCVSWHDARAYTAWLSKKTGKHYRLPSESEWEYAGRGNSIVIRYQEADPDKACAFANIMDMTGKAKIPGVTWETHNCDDGYDYTAPVGSYHSNGFGLNDMLGNAWEWVEDSYHEDYQNAPVDGSAWNGSGEFHVLRGGSWSDDPNWARVATRDKEKPEARNCAFGFRVVRELP
jgi:formylglycine-generating enzyme required for sulfatase activity